MSIPRNITKEHLLAAISKIDTEGIPKDEDSKYYDVIYNGKKYPPKLVVSWANIFANGEPLDRNMFEGGIGTPCFILLEKNGFVIIKKGIADKISFYGKLKEFLSVSAKQNTGHGTTIDAKIYNQNIDKSIEGLRIDVSFGIGRATAVPWISFLAKGQKTSDGIYPVYLFFKEKNLLILAYGVSETKKPVISWNLNDVETIEQFFNKKKLGKPEKYGQSFVFKTYDTTEELSERDVNADLSEIISAYKQVFLFNMNIQEITNENDTTLMSKKFDYLDFYNSLLTANLHINKSMVLRFIASLLTKPFVILTGLSGSGKTKLAQAFATWICENENQYRIVPVGADWTSREPLLGFPNSLKANEYVKPDNGILDLMIEASNNASKPYFLILDEMNLSHVERYFADFLSVMESQGKIALHPGSEEWNGVPATITFPQNLFIIGTVNIDETTYMFSPKVLDRANVLEFRITEKEMESYFQSSLNINIKDLAGKGAAMAKSFVSVAKDDFLQSINLAEPDKVLISFFKELKKIGAEFGYRSASEIRRFVTLVNELEAASSLSYIIDAAIMQKLLPKVHGSRRKLEPVLRVLGTLCLQDEEKFDDYLVTKRDMDFSDTTKIKYPISLEKILRMNESLISNGFTSYAEV